MLTAVAAAPAKAEEMSIHGSFAGCGDHFVVAAHPLGFFVGAFDPQTASAVWTNWKGSISNQTVSFELVHQILPHIYTFRQTVVFTGGTGRYAGASGGACFEGLINIATNSYVGVIDGSNRQVIFETDFDNGAPPEISGFTATEPIQGYDGVGNGESSFGGQMKRNDWAMSTHGQLPNRSKSPRSR